jgi:hypothetical protein
MPRDSWRCRPGGRKRVQAKMGKCADRFIQNNATMVEDFLKLCSSLPALVCCKIRFSSHIYGIIDIGWPSCTS